MAGEILSASMSLPVPGVGITAGPQWATDVNNCLTIIDTHNHTQGYGVQIPSAGLNINADLSFANNNAINLRSTRFSSQSAVLALASDLNCAYVVGVDLYYNDGNGNNIRLTQDGAVAGTPGSISNLVAPASASYNNLSSTFIFQSNVNTAANMDIASLILRNNTANSFSMTLSPPNAMSSDTVITLPTIPAALSLVSINPSGNLGTISPQFLVPSGTMLPFSGSSTPPGYLICDGSAVSRTTYADLFAIIGTTYGIGDGSSTFNLPTPAETLYFNSSPNGLPSYVQSYWKMNQPSGAEPNEAQPGGTYDLVPTGTVPSTTGWVTGIGSRGIFTSGTNYFTVPLLGSSSTPYDSNVFAFGFWMKTNATGIFNNIAGKSGPGSKGWYVRVAPSGYIAANFNQGSDITATSGNVADGQWHLVFIANMATGGAGNFRIYVDNNLVLSTAGQSFVASTFDLGVGATTFGASDAFNGYLSLVEFWDTMPSSWTTFQTRINLRWNGGLGVDYVPQIPVNYIIKT